MNDESGGSRILIVDDMPENLDVIGGILSDYKRVFALDGETALKVARSKHPPDLILLDVMMPGIDGYEVCKRLKADKKTRDIPVIFVTAKSTVEDESIGFELGAVDFIIKPVSPPIVRARVRTHLRLQFANAALKNQNILLEEKVRTRTEELALTQEVTIHSLSSLIEYRDPETGGHIRRTQYYVKILAEDLKHHPLFAGDLTDEFIELLFKSVPLHDIGKIGVPDSILLKPGKLTSEEFEIMKKHTIYGHDAILSAEKALGSNSFLRIAGEIAYTHHEKWDGTGYPQGLKEAQIPISGRLMALADVYDSFISKRLYKPPYPHEKALNIIREQKGRHFDPAITDSFLKLEARFKQISMEFSDNKITVDRILDFT